jgi:hypothetical protein
MRFGGISNDTAATMHCIGGPVEKHGNQEVCKPGTRDSKRARRLLATCG